jgi:hypothetical protein
MSQVRGVVAHRVRSSGQQREKSKEKKEKKQAIQSQAALSCWETNFKVGEQDKKQQLAACASTRLTLQCARAQRERHARRAETRQEESYNVRKKNSSFAAQEAWRKEQRKRTKASKSMHGYQNAL